MNERDMLRRVLQLEDLLNLPPFRFGSTRIGWECLTPQEQKLFEWVHKLQATYGDNPPAQVLKENHDILNKARQLMWLRSLDLFNTVIDSLYLNQSIDKYIFWTRFFHFIRETIFIINRLHLEDSDLEKRFGKNIDEWPEDDDPRWKEHTEFMDAWEREQKKQWEVDDKELQDMTRTMIKKAMEEEGEA